ncbi:MAG TPA: AMP-binding protein [Clostridiaceae bacterium]|jgi:acetyl-CoA synthetase|nr:AMP-binding protein [Clostridiaceae bacterium]
MLSRFLPRESFDSYEDFINNYHVEVPENFNFARDVVDAWASEDHEKPALVWCNDAGDEKRMRFSDISMESARAAVAFSRMGMKKGDTVLFLMKRRWQFWIYAPAFMRLGVIFIPATVQLTQKDIEYRVKAASVDMIITITEPVISKAVEDALPACPEVRAVGYIESEPLAKAAEKPFAPPAAWVDLNRTIASIADVDAEAMRDMDLSVGGKDPMLLYFTSGTTGMPKMVLHNHEHPLGHIVTAHYWQQLRSDDLHISVADTGWAKCGWGKIYGQWICGAANFVYDMDRFHAHDLLEKISRYKVTTFCAPPTIYRYMIQEDLSQYDLSSLRMALTAGEPLQAEVFNRFRDGTGLQIMEGFGQTETSVLCASFPWDAPRPGSMGKPAPLYKLDIIDDEDRSCPPGTEGRVVVTGLDDGSPVGLFCGYFRDDATTRLVWHDGYYETGDVAWRDEDGFYWFVGRSDDVIKCSGYRIGPFEVESALQTHRAVLECAITAAPDEIRGQVVKATIVLAPGYEPTEDLKHELQAHVKHVTAPYKYPRIIEFVTELPKTISGKIRRVEIRGNDEKK